MKARLGFAHRIRLRESLPNMGRLDDVILGKAIDKRLDFTIEEAKEYSIFQEEGGYKWDSEKVVDFEFNDDEVELFSRRIPISIKAKDSIQDGLVDIALIEVAMIFGVDLEKISKEIKEEEAKKEKQAKKDNKS